MSVSGTPYSSSRSKGPGRPASLMTSAVSSIVTKRPLPSSPLTSRVMRRSSIPAAEALGNEIDELLAAENPFRVGRIHDRLLGAGKAQSGPGDHDGAGGHLVAVVRA